MFIYAHPDDIEFSAGGTAALWAKKGCELTYIIITDGSIGTDDESLTQAQLAEMRQKEQREAADITGITHIEFLGYPDGRLQPTLELRKELTRLIRKYRPNVVFSGDPSVWIGSENYINHPDHRAAAAAALEAVFPSADSPLLYPDLIEQGYASHKVNYVYISSWRDADLYIDISDTLDVKIAALHAHKSQFVNWDPADRIRQWTADVGKKVGFAHAEGFRRITLREDEPEQP
jgi:LmbE family N-acetylglucosaminyl deacetylase